MRDDRLKANLLSLASLTLSFILPLVSGIMIYVRIKFTKCVFGKIVMWLFIAVLVVVCCVILCYFIDCARSCKDY